MTHKYVLLVDYENVGKVDLNAIPADVLVPFFFGTSQKSVSTQFMKAALKLGPRFIPIDIEGHGSNALDFHIAFYLGEYLAADPAVCCIILSKDQGFDPLVKHLRKRNFDVRRAVTLTELFAPSPAEAVAAPRVTKDMSDATALSPLELAVKWLSEMQPRVRPRKRKSLVTYLDTRFGKKLAEPALQAVVDRLIEERKVTQEGRTLGYDL